MLKLFAKYTSIGVLNTLIHWVVFGVCIYIAHTNQALANFAGFVVAVSFSFFANAKFTFKASTTTMRYMLYVGFMGTLSAIIIIIYIQKETWQLLILIRNCVNK